MVRHADRVRIQLPGGPVTPNSRLTVEESLNHRDAIGMDEVEMPGN